MIKKAIFLLLCLTYISTIYSYTNISNCPYTISVSGEYRLNQSINRSEMNCVIVNVDDVILDCQYYNISGENDFGSKGIDINNDNVSIENCNILRFNYGIYVDGNYAKATNIVTINNSYGLSISYSNGIYKNINGDDSSAEIRLFGTINNVLTNITAEKIQADDSSNNILNNTNVNILMFWGGKDNTILSSQINSIFFIHTGIIPTQNNTFYNNTFGSSCSISSSNWTLTPNYFNYSSYGNTYTDDTCFTSDCFTASNGNTCDYHKTIIPVSITQSTGSNVFPFNSKTSILLTLSVVIGYFVFS